MGYIEEDHSSENLASSILRTGIETLRDQVPEVMHQANIVLAQLGTINMHVVILPEDESQPFASFRLAQQGKGGPYIPELYLRGIAWESHGLTDNIALGWLLPAIGVAGECLQAVREGRTATAIREIDYTDRPSRVWEKYLMIQDQFSRDRNLPRFFVNVGQKEISIDPRDITNRGDLYENSGEQISISESVETGTSQADFFSLYLAYHNMSKEQREDCYIDIGVTDVDAIYTFVSAITRIQQINFQDFQANPMVGYISHIQAGNDKTQSGKLAHYYLNTLLTSSHAKRNNLLHLLYQILPSSQAFTLMRQIHTRTLYETLEEYCLKQTNNTMHFLQVDPDLRSMMAATAFAKKLGEIPPKKE